MKIDEREKLADSPGRDSNRAFNDIQEKIDYENGQDSGWRERREEPSIKEQKIPQIESDNQKLMTGSLKNIEDIEDGDEKMVFERMNSLGLNSLMKMNIPVNYKIDFITQYFYCSRSPYRDIVYWISEIAVWIVLLVFIINIKTEQVTLTRKYDPPQYMTGFKRTDFQDPSNEPGILISGIKAPLHYFDSHFNNREFSSVCMIYVLKYALYLLESIYFNFRTETKENGDIMRVGSLFDTVAPLANCFMWLMWFIWSHSFSGHQINAGIYYRFEKDIIDSKLSSQILYQHEYDQRLSYLEQYKSTNMKWPWLWCVPVGTIVLLIISYIVGLIRMRTSGFTGVSVTSVIIPIQLILLHLFFSGNLILSNGGLYSILIDLQVKKDFDNYEIRWVFTPIYLLSYLAPLTSIACIYKSYRDFKNDVRLSGIKFASYGLLWIFGWIWIMLMDKLMYEEYVRVKGSVVGIHIVILLISIVSASCSIYDKVFIEGMKKYIDRNLRLSSVYNMRSVYG